MQKLTGSTKLKQVAKSASVEPVPQGSKPLHSTQEGLPVKRGRGRPRKVSLSDIHKGEVQTDPKALLTFRRAIADAEKLEMTVPDFDGGGTKENAPTVTKESLQRRVSRRLNVLDRYLTDDKLIELLTVSSLKEVGIFEGIMMDKALVLQGQPNVIIGNNERSAIQNAMPRVLEELKRRGMITTVRERSIEFQNGTS